MSRYGVLFFMDLFLLYLLMRGIEETALQVFAWL